MWRQASMNINNAHQFHIHPSLVTDDAVVIPIGELYRQMSSVLRIRKGDAVRFFDGVGNVYEGAVAHVNKDGILVPIQNRFVQPRGGEIQLAIGILKNDRMRWVLEKATELGVSTIVPMISERVVKRPEKVPSRWQHIVREAAEQSGRAWLPEIRGIAPYHEILAAAEHPILFSTEAEPGDLPAFEKPPTLFIGPEGGFTDDEIALAKREGASIASLGEHQLRADTAAIVALARM